MLHIKLKGITNAAHSRKLFAHIPPYSPDPGIGLKGQNSFFSENGQVAHQIKGNQECSNMVANILPADPLPHDPGAWVKRSIFNLFRTWSCCK